jgi:hypothetical protein
LKSKRVALGVSIGYIVLSVVGWLWADRFLHAAPKLYIAAQWVLGPLAFAFNLRSGMLDAPALDDWLVCYLVATAVLILCLVLLHQRSPFIKSMGAMLAILTWLASGFLNFAAMFAGV